MNPDRTAPVYHVLLIGIDAYPPAYNSLSGCVNDIDAIEQILLDPPGIGFPPEQIHITRLAASSPRRPSNSRFQEQTQPPTKANLIQALKALAGPEVKPHDRVLIYYSGHGDQKLWPGSPVWHEAMVPHDGQRIEYLYDVEVNALINAIAARTSDLTIILDCCHSAGTTRGDLEDSQSQGADRYLNSDPTPGQVPDFAMLGLPDEPSANMTSPAQMLQSLDPNYLVIVACLPDEKAGEGKYPGEPRPLGILTYSLLSLLTSTDTKKRVELRWADIWPQLLDNVITRCGQLGRRPQQPWYIGRTERRIFGGPWELQDIGYRITRLPDARYTIGAGTLMGLTQNAEVAVYGPAPPLFPEIGSPNDHPLGRLQVVQAERASCVAIPIGPSFDLPLGARGRLVKPGESERLRVALKPEDASLVAELSQSPLLEVVPAGTPHWDVEVITQPDGGWTIGNDVEALLARVPRKESPALRAGLDWYYRYHTVLRLAKNCNDPQLSSVLSIRLLDCSDTTALKAMTQEELADPKLPEVGRDNDRNYFVKQGSRSCIKLSNTSSYTLQVTILNCSAGGLVEYMGVATLREDANDVIWARNEPGKGFRASVDELPLPKDSTLGVPFVTDRLIAIGTTRRDVDLHYLSVDKTVQQVVDENILQRSLRSLTEEDEDVERSSTGPVELWTATITPLRIAR